MKHIYIKNNLFLKKIVMLLAFIFLSMNISAQCDWNAIGPDESDQPSFGPVKYTSIASYGSNQLFVAYAEQSFSLNGRVTVTKYNGTRWNILGTRGFSSGKAENVKIKIDKFGTPYVAFKDGGNGNKASVMKYNGTAWIYVGNPGFSIGAVNYTTLGIDTSGAILVSYQDSSNGNKATVMKYNGTTWSNVGTSGFSSGASEYNTLALSSNGTPYVTFSDYANGQKTSVMKYDGTSWIYAGIAGFTNTITKNQTIGINALDQIYVASSQGIHQYNGTNWQSMTLPTYITTFFHYGNFAFDANQVPYFIFKDGNVMAQSTILKYSGTAWIGYAVAFTSGVPAQGDADYQGLTVTGSGALVAINTHTLFGNKALLYVSPTNNSGSTPTYGIGVYGINGTNPLYSFTPQFTIQSYTPYVAYIDGSNSRDFYISSFNGSSWNNILGPYSGPTWFNGAKGTDIKLGVQGATPYVIVSGSGYGAELHKYTGNGWQRIGLSIAPLMFPDPFNANSNNAISPDGNYVAFGDKGNAGRLSVKQISGSSLLNIGIDGFSSGAISNIKIEFPYVAYCDASNGNKLTVMKYNGTAWINVGTSAISTGTASNLSLKKDNLGYPYIGYFDAGLNKYEVQNFDGVNWINLNVSSLVSSGFNAITLDNTNSPYIAYSNKVIRYKNNAWSQVASNINGNIIDIKTDVGGAINVFYGSVGGLYAKKLGATNNSGGYTSNATPCSGSNINLTGYGGTSYQWTGPNNFSSTTSNPTLNNVSSLASGNYTVIANDSICNSAISTTYFSIQVKQAYNITKTLSLCKGKSYSVGASVYTSSGNYIDTLASTFGCDSMVNSNITFFYNPTTSQTITLVNGQSITIGTHTYNSSGVFTDTLSTNGGCDSILITTINTINQINNAVTVNSNTISVVQQGATYQWINTNTNTIIAGQTSPTFTATQNGTYACQITIGNITVTSSSTVISNIGLEKINGNNYSINIHPNPNNGTFKINTNTEAQLSIYDALGRTILQQTIKAGESSITLNNEKSGVYYAKVMTANQQWVKRIVMNKN
jgi:hypothetical protein